MKRILLFILLVQALLGQNVPFNVAHPVYHFLERQESLGRISGEYWSTRPFTYTQINTMLDEIETQSSDLNTVDLRTLRRFQKEFNRELTDEGITFPWSRSTISGVIRPQEQDLRPFFMSYKMDETSGWINWSETFRAESNGDGFRGNNTDFLGIYGVRGKLAFTTQFTYHRVTKSDHFDTLPDSYKEGYLLERDYMRWISWDYPTSSLTYAHDYFTLGIHRQPIYWGYSADNSPILSDNTSPLAHIEWTTEMKHLRFKFIHARLTPNGTLLKDTTNTRRNLSAHRVEFDITPNFEFAFNEMVIYAHRDFELGYLNPVNFLFAEEQAQGDLDNKLMALDFKWRILSGLTTYGTWFIDELDFYKLFSGWWGNKFVFQLGASYYPSVNLPSLTVEYTAARPWTYSHLYPVNSFTSGGRGLGLKQGPNSQILKVSSTWQPTPSLYLEGTFTNIQQGHDPGSDPLNSYISRAEIDGEDQDFLSGDIESDHHMQICGLYYFSPVTQLLFSWTTENILELGVQLSW